MLLADEDHVGASKVGEHDLEIDEGLLAGVVHTLRHISRRRCLHGGRRLGRRRLLRSRRGLRQGNGDKKGQRHAVLTDSTCPASMDAPVRDRS